MRPTFSLLTAASLTTAAALTPMAAASPFDAALVAADAQWFIHVDVEAILASELGEFLLEHADDFGAELDHLEEMQEQFGFDPMEAIYGVTVYGYDEPGEHPIIVLVGSNDIANALEKAIGMDGSPVTKTAGGYSIDDELEITVLEGRGGVVAYVASEEADLAKDGAAVLSGQRSNLADAKWGKLRAVDSKGALIVLSTTGSIQDLANGHGHDMGPAGAFLDGAEGFSVVLSERGEDISLTVGMTAADEKKASGLKSMLNGLVSMAHGLMQMQVDDDDFEEIKQFAGLLDGLNINTDGRDVTLSLSYNLDQLIDLLENADF